jgi:PKD repeat protein
MLFFQLPFWLIRFFYTAKCTYIKHFKNLPRRKMMKKLGINLFVVFAVSVFLANFVLADQIIDNNSPNVALSGTWYSSTLVPGYYGTNYIWAYGGTAAASAQYTFELPSNGYYQVQVWHSAPYSTRSSDAPFTIYHAAGSTTVRVDQRVNGSRWNDIGTYYFLSGEARVVLTNDASGNPVADAVRIVEVTSPVADFVAAPLTGAAPLNVSFESRSAGNISSFLWNFGDGQTSTEQNPVHQYLSAGIYTVTLEVVGPEGSDLETKTNFITVTQPGAFEQIIDNGTTGFTQVAPGIPRRWYPVIMGPIMPGPTAAPPPQPVRSMPFSSLQWLLSGAGVALCPL